MRKFLILTVGLIFMSLLGCTGAFKQAYFLVDESLRDPDFHLKGVRMAFVTLGSEDKSEDRWILLDVFAKTIQEKRKGMEVLLPGQSLSLINQAGMAKEYNETIKDYQTSGIFEKKILEKLGGVLKAQYLARLSLVSFDQYSSTRFSFLGLRTVESQLAKMRLFAQIWKTNEGKIVWEGSGEGIITRERFRARPVGFHELARLACEKLVEKLP